MINRKAFLTKAIEEGFKNKVNGYPLTLKHSKGKKLLDYKIYGNSVQYGTPTPDNPVDVRSCGDKTNNLIDFSKYTWTQMNGNNCKYEFDNNVVTIERTSVSNAVGIFTYIDLPAGTYTISISNIEANISYESKTNFVYSPTFSVIREENGFKKTFTLTEDTNVQVYLYLPEVKDIKIGNKIKYSIQLENGSEVTEHEPYGYKIPITASSKNLWTTDITYPIKFDKKAVIEYDSNTQTYILNEAYGSISMSIYKLENPIPAGTKVTMYMYILEGNIAGNISFGGYHNLQRRNKVMAGSN